MCAWHCIWPRTAWLSALTITPRPMYPADGRKVFLDWKLHDIGATVEKDGISVSGDSIMGLLMLTAPRGSTIVVTTQGAQAAQLADALTALVGDYFGEGM